MAPDNDLHLYLEEVSCPLCGGERQAVVARGMDREYATCNNTFFAVRCDGCGFHYLNPRPKREDLGIIYPPTYHSYILEKDEKKGPTRNEHHALDWITVLREQAGSRRFQNAFRFLGARTGHIKLLDVGCGGGWLLDKFKRMLGEQLQTYGLEISEQVCEKARRKGHNVFWGPMEEYPTDVTFDIINICHVIEHVPDPKGLVHKAARLLNQGGILIVETPNFNTIDRRSIKAISEGCWGGYHFPRHWHFFEEQSLTQLMKDSGLTVCSVKYFPTPTTWAWTLNKWADRWPRWLAWTVRPFCHPIKIFTGNLLCTAGMIAFYLVDRTLLLFGFQTGTIQIVAKK